MNIESQALIVNLVVFAAGALILLWIYRKSKQKTKGGCAGGGCGCKTSRKKITWKGSMPSPKKDNPAEH